MTELACKHQEASRSHHCDHPDLADGLSLDPMNELAASETGGAWGRPEHRPPHRTGSVGCCTGLEELRQKGVDKSCPLCRKPLPPGPEKLYDLGYGMIMKIKAAIDRNRPGVDHTTPWPALSGFF